MKENTWKRLVRIRKGLRQMSYRKKRRLLRFIWFLIAVAFVIQITLLDGGGKSFY